MSFRSSRGRAATARCQRLSPRPVRPVAVAALPSEADAEAEADADAEPESPPVAVQHATPLLVLFGSNLGSTEDLARQLAVDGTARGFATTVAPLDEYVDRLPTQGVVAIATASYNGNPPDNAARFVEWVSGSSLAPDALRGVKYTVFGCGSREWASTYQKVPGTIDAQLAAHGAERVYTHGEGDVSDDFDGQFRTWAGPLWPALAAAVGVAVEGTDEVDAGHRYEVVVEAAEEAAAASPFRAEYGARAFTIQANRELHRKSGPNPSPRSTRHIEVALADGVQYLPGDYLGVLPHNSDDLVRRVATRFKLEPTARLRIVNNSTSKSFLPVDQPIDVATLLGSYVDVQDVATRSQIQVLAEYAECPPERQRLLALAGDDADSTARYRKEVLDAHISVLDLLEDNQSCSLPFNIYLEFLPPLKPRYYSISSSPMVDAQQCSVTVGVLDAPARSGHGRYHGVCSTYLSGQAEGTIIEGFIKNPSTQFRLAGQSRNAADHGRHGHRVGAVSWLSAGTRRLAEERPDTGSGAAVLRLPRSAAGLPVRGRAARLPADRRRQCGVRVFSSGESAEDVRAGRHQSPA